MRRKRSLSTVEVEVLMAKRWVIWSVAGVLLVAAVAAAALTGSFGGHRAHDVAGRTAVSPSPAETPTPTPTPKPRHTGGSNRHHAAASRGSAASRQGTARSSGAGQADPCAHNHHCYVPPMPPLKPDPHRPPVGSPSVTVTGAPVAPPPGT
jgi:hypothetical protein